MDTLKPLVTIIVPIYNGEKTIERCLTSIRNQSYNEIEVFVVDDGSKDHSSIILNKFEQMDARFHIIKKKNTGVSDSRNIAIKKAKGKYIQFVDCDDWIVKDATKWLVEAAEKNNAGMVISDYIRVTGKTLRPKGSIKKSGILTREEFAKEMMKAPANFYYGVLWNKFFRTDIVKAQGLLCSTKLDWCEDFQFNLEYLKYVGNIYVLHQPIYYYVKTKGSLVDTKTDFKQTIKTKRILFEYYKELYIILDLYEKNKFRISSFYVEFARDTKPHKDEKLIKKIKQKIENKTSYHY